MTCFATVALMCLPVLDESKALNGGLGAARLPVTFPVTFIENAGQFQPEARFVARAGGLSTFVRSDGFVVQRLDDVAPDLEQGDPGRTRGVNLFFTIEGTHGARAGACEARMAEVRGLRELPGRHHFLRGADRSRWVKDARGFAAARIVEPLAGIDVVLHGDRGLLEYDLVLATGARLADLVLRCDGADGLRIAEDGALEAITRFGMLRQLKPRAWTDGVDGSRREIDVEFALLDERRFTFHARGRRDDESLTIDPGLEWSTFFGGTDVDRGQDLAVANDGTVTLAGRGLSTDLPTTPGCFDDSYNGDSAQPERIGDVWVMRLAPDGATLLWSTYLGGSANDHVNELLLAADGDAIVSGWTGSDDFPATPGAYDESFNGLGSGLFLGGDVYVTRIESDGSDLAWSTYLGGSDLEYTIGMGMDASENVCVTGHVHSHDFPTTSGAWQESTTNHSEIFVSKVAADGSALLFSTYFGGDEEEYSHGLAVAADGSVTLAGGTNSTDMPVTAGVVDAVYDGGDTISHNVEGFVVRFTADLSALVWMTYLGRTGTDSIYGMQLAPDGGVLLTGETSSTDFYVTSGGFDDTHDLGMDAFVLRLSPDATQIDWGTYLGAEGEERGEGIALERCGTVVVSGRTTSTLFPTTAGAYDTTYGGGADVMVARLSADGSRLLYSSYVGGTAFEAGHEVAIDGTAAATIGGETYSSGFPTTPGAYDTTFNKKGDGFVARLDLLPTGASRYGASTPGCDGLIAIGVDGLPQQGASVALTCRDAPPSSPGFLAIAFGRLDPPGRLVGVDFWLDPTTGLLLLPGFTSDANGYVEAAGALPSGSAGVTFDCQWLWVDACGSKGFSASNALEITIQP